MKPSSRPTEPATAPAGIERPTIGAPAHRATPDERLPPHDEQPPPHRDGDPVPIEPAQDDLDLLAEPVRRVTRLTLILIAAVIAGVAFVGGVVVQRQVGGSAGTAGGGAASAMPGGASGFGGFGAESGGFGGGANGFGGGSGDADGSDADTGRTDAGRGGAGADSASSGAPVVVGTVTRISGRTLTVKNFAGSVITVKVPVGTTISDSSKTALGGLTKGVAVSVVGSEAADGTVTASSITAS